MSLPELMREKWAGLSQGKRSFAVALFMLFMGSLLFLLGTAIGDAIYRAYN